MPPSSAHPCFSFPLHSSRHPWHFSNHSTRCFIFMQLHTISHGDLPGIKHLFCLWLTGAVRVKCLAQGHVHNESKEWLLVADSPSFIRLISPFAFQHSQHLFTVCAHLLFDIHLPWAFTWPSELLFFSILQ